MATFRDQKRQARRQLHAALAEPVLYLNSRTDAPVEVTCRLHLSFEQLGDLHGSRAGFGERQEVTPSIIFLNDQGVTPVRDGYVITRDMGAYFIANTLSPDDITTKVEVSVVEKPSAEKYGWDLSAPWCGFQPPAGA